MIQGESGGAHSLTGAMTGQILFIQCFAKPLKSPEKTVFFALTG
jgi:hypothetical protein